MKKIIQLEIVFPIEDTIENDRLKQIEEAEMRLKQLCRKAEKRFKKNLKKRKGGKDEEKFVEPEKVWTKGKYIYLNS